MKRTVVVVVGLLLAAGLFACTKYGKGKNPQLEIEIGGESVYGEYEPATAKAADELCPPGMETQTETQCCPSGLFLGPGDLCYERYKFDTVRQGQPAKQIQVAISNTGNKDLKVTNVYLEEGGNPYISILWDEGASHKPEDFPVVVEPDLPTPLIQFFVEYAPVAGMVDVSPAVLVIESNDPRYEKGDYQNKYKMLLSIKSVGPAAVLNRKNITYSCVSACSPEQVTIDNEGTDTLVIQKIDFASPATEFSLINTPALPLEIPKKGDPTYNTLTFSVRYCPGDDYYEDTNDLLITTNDMNNAGGVISVPLKVVQSPAILEFSSDSPFSYLDFSEEKTHSLNIYNLASSECEDLCPDKGQCCGCPIQLKGVDMDPPDVAQWYTVTAKDPTNDTVLSLPRALKGGGAIEFEVAYQKPAGHPEDRNGTMCIRYVSPLAGPQNYCVSLMAQSQCEFSLAPISQVLHFNSASPSEVKEKPVMLYNTGSAACSVSGVSITDKWGSVSEDFSLKDVIAGDTQIPPFGLVPVWVKYSPHSTDLNGKLIVKYKDDVVGDVDTTVNLIGAKEQACKLPVANPGSADLYSAATVGQMVTLNGCGSANGSCGEAIFDNGYIWFLVSKPANSTATLNTEGSCMASFQPDLPGEYEVGLMVYDGVAFLQSDLSTVKFTAAAAE